jgi:hypothetical protein
MSMLDLAKRMQDAQPSEIVPAGEYELQLTGGKLGKNKHGFPYVSYMFKILNPPQHVISPKPVNSFHWLIPDEDVEKFCEVYSKQMLNDNDYNLRLMYEALDFDYTQDVDTLESPKGSTGWAILKTKTDDYGEKNEISSWVNRK